MSGNYDPEIASYNHKPTPAKQGATILSKGWRLPHPQCQHGEGKGGVRAERAGRMED